MKKKHFISIYCCLAIIAAVLLYPLNMLKTSAESSFVDGKSYEVSDETGYDISGIENKNTLCYGEKSIGKLRLAGEYEKLSNHNGFIAYGMSDEINFSYTYNGGYHTDNSYDWNISDSNEKSVNGADLKKDIDYGAIVVQTSEDGKSWKTAHSQINLFKKKSGIIGDFYTITTDNVRDGLYYRVMVAYNMSKKVSKFKSEEKGFLEIYDFYVCYNKNPILIRDIETGQELSGNQLNTQKGFIIDKAGTDYEVTVKKDNGKVEKATDQTSFTKPGKYTVSVKTNLGEEYVQTVTIKDGMELMTITPSVFNGNKDDEYEMINKTRETVYGMSSLTSLKLATAVGYTTKENRTSNPHQYGIYGSSVGLYLRINNNADLNGYAVNADTWGKKEKQKICDAYVGTVNTGALIIQKSTNGTDWTTLGNDKYANGLYTTDFYKHYNNSGDVPIYTPSGRDIEKGVYLRVIYAYQMKKKDGKETKRYLEVYSMYLCNNDLDAVTIHNLSSQDKIADTLGEDQKSNIELYKFAETLYSGSGTATGFSVDTSKNQTVKVSVKRDGQQVDIPENKEFTTNGKYDITLESVLGDKKNITIYVDTSNSENALKEYFPEGFISGKRIYSEGEYPVYEGGGTTYSIPAINDSLLALTGEIRNDATGKTIAIGNGRTAKSGTIEEKGQYTATLSTRPKKDGSELPGDYRTFTFKFEIIAQGTAPGPVVNKRNLTEYCKKNNCDCYPMYYGVTYSSGWKGDITLAFSTRKDAEDYAYKYEKGLVEEQDDGKLYYKGDNETNRKEIYDDYAELTAKINDVAKEKVQVLYFDMSDPFCYRTLTEDVIDKNDNLRKVELTDSVIIFADEQKREKLFQKNKLLVINDKKYEKMSTGRDENKTTGYEEFCFISDDNGYDSDSVTITDCNGKEYSIEYHKSVGKQLAEQNCPSGEITINEKTIYGDSTSYKAMYIAENDNTAVLTLAYYSDGSEKKQQFRISDNDSVFDCDAFRIDNLSDELDPFSIVTVTDSKGKKSYHVADQDAKLAWSEQGEYTVSVVNRLGYSYSFKVNIAESNYVTFKFEGAGTEGLSDDIQVNITADYKLPELTLYGYTLKGFKDEKGTLHSGEINNILFKGEKVLEAVWEAKQVDLRFTDTAGNEIADTLQLNYDDKYLVSDLPIPELSSGLKFDGWMMNGEMLSEDSITIDTESDIVLVAAVSDKEIETEAEDTTPENNEKEKSSSALVIILTIIAVIAIIPTVAFMYVKRRNDSEKNKNK